MFNKLTGRVRENCIKWVLFVWEKEKEKGIQFSQSFCDVFGEMFIVLS